MAKIYPVIHVTGSKQASENLSISLESGADGAFLIGHGMSHKHLCRIFLTCREQFPDAWLGINFLDLPPHLAMGIVVSTDARVDALWTDYSNVDDVKAGPLAERTREIQKDSEWHGLYFGGVAFKGQKEVADYTQAAKNAAPYMDFITTSGEWTGVAAQVSKIESMWREGPLALASGVSAQNIRSYLPMVQSFLVASSISKSFDRLDPAKTEELVLAARNTP